MQLQRVLRATITPKQIGAILAYFKAVRNSNAYVILGKNLTVAFPTNEINTALSIKSILNFTLLRMLVGML
jgi:hypothetical protein